MKSMAASAMKRPPPTRPRPRRGPPPLAPPAPGRPPPEPPFLRLERSGRCSDISLPRYDPEASTSTADDTGDGGAFSIPMIVAAPQRSRVGLLSDDAYVIGRMVTAYQSDCSSC